MKYGFDIDDTLSDTSEIICKYAKKFDKEQLGRCRKFKKIEDAVDYYYFADALNWDRKDIEKFFNFYYLNVLREVKVKEGVSIVMKRIRESGNKIYLITSRRERADGIIRKITEDWLKKNEIPFDGLYIDIKEKYDLVNELKIDIFVDDSYKNCMDVMQNCNAKIYMVENKFNKNIIDNSINKIKKIEEIIL